MSGLSVYKGHVHEYLLSRLERGGGSSGSSRMPAAYIGARDEAEAGLRWRSSAASAAFPCRGPRPAAGWVCHRPPGPREAASWQKLKLPS